MTRLPDSFYFKAKNSEAYENTASISPQEAIKIAIEKFGKVSAPYLQTKCKISFKEAERQINIYY
jgi:hypothetical protein